MTKPGMVIKPDAFGSLVCSHGSLIGGMSKLLTLKLCS